MKSVLLQHNVTGFWIILNPFTWHFCFSLFLDMVLENCGAQTHHCSTHDTPVFSLCVRV